MEKSKRITWKKMIKTNPSSFDPMLEVSVQKHHSSFLLPIYSVSFVANFKLTTQLSQLSQQLSDLDEDGCLSLGSGEDSEGQGPSAPLFLHFTCTLRSGNQILTSTSIEDLPTCLGECP